MRVRVEPKEFFMYSVFLAFRQQRPDPEDEAVKAYLTHHELIPKMTGTDTLDDQEYEVMYFGGCYLGKHLQVIGEMQQKSVREEMLAVEIERALNEPADRTASRAVDNTPEHRMKKIIARLVDEFHQDSSFEADEEGYLKVTLEPAVIQRKFDEMAGGAA